MVPELSTKLGPPYLLCESLKTGTTKVVGVQNSISSFTSSSRKEGDNVCHSRLLFRKEARAAGSIATGKSGRFQVHRYKVEGWEDEVRFGWVVLQMTEK